MGYLSWGVPMMAYALVTGSTYAMVGAISSMDSAGRGASIAAGAQAASGNAKLGNDSMGNYSADNKSMHNLSEMDKSTGNTNKNNYSSGNINKNGLSEIVDGSVINGKSTNPNEVQGIMSQKGLSESQKVEELAKSGSFTGSVTGKSGEGVSTYNIANGVATETSTADGGYTEQQAPKQPGGMSGGPNPIGLGGNMGGGVGFSANNSAGTSSANGTSNSYGFTASQKVFDQTLTRDLAGEKNLTIEKALGITQQAYSKFKDDTSGFGVKPGK